LIWWAKTISALVLAAATIFYFVFVVPIWVIGQGLAGAPIFELHPMVLSVEAVGVFIGGLWWAWFWWVRKSAPPAREHLGPGR
jgi:hypothetical protein